jgi:acetyltransferase-like isoleucine patch superfamily enzyme
MKKPLVQLLVLLMPWRVRRLVLTKVLGFAIADTARVGLSILFADEVRMAKGARLGHFNYIGRLDLLQLDDNATIGNFNWITGLSRRMNSPFFTKKTNRRSDLVLGKCSMIAHQHYIDCTDRVVLGAFAGIAGARSQLITHGVEPIAARQTCAPIMIGDFTMIGSGSIILKGVKIPECCLVSAGSVVGHARPEPYSLIAGNPATHVRTLPETAKFFHRTGNTIY